MAALEYGGIFYSVHPPGWDVPVGVSGGVERAASVLIRGRAIHLVERADFVVKILEKIVQNLEIFRVGIPPRSGVTAASRPTGAGVGNNLQVITRGVERR